MPCPLLIFSQSGYLIQIVVINLHTWWQTVQIQISWRLKKPTDLDLHCLQNRVYPGSAGQGLILDHSKYNRRRRKWWAYRPNKYTLSKTNKPYYLLRPKQNICTNSVYPDEMARHKFSIFAKVSRFRDRWVHFRNSGVKVLDPLERLNIFNKIFSYEWC